jgi:protoporphyrinogen oxidase
MEMIVPKAPTNEMPIPSAQHVLVLGAGIAGLAAADALNRAGYRVTVLERGSAPGGAHRSHQIGPYTFDVGSIFYDDKGLIFSLAPENRELCPAVHRIERRIAPDGKLLSYPIEPRELLHWGYPKLSKALLDLLLRRQITRLDGTLETICLARLGRTIYTDTGLKSYITRFNHTDPRLLDEEFFLYRMGFIERQTRLSALLGHVRRALFGQAFRAANLRPSVLRVRPRDGFLALFTPLQQRLEAAGVVFAMNEELQRIEGKPAGYVVQTSAGTHRCDIVVNTIPLDTLHTALFGTPSGIGSLDLMTLFVSARRLAPAMGNVLFNFHATGRWKRATIYSRLYSDPAVAREYLSVEHTILPGAAADPETAFAEFKAQLEGFGHAEDLRLEGHDRVSDCYPLYRPGTHALRPQILKRIEATGVVTVGRQGRFEYLPTSSGVIRRVLEELAAAGLSMPADMKQAAGPTP